jgi:CRISPR/Cas system CMR-associated protein Cmr5 small subunit
MATAITPITQQFSKPYLTLDEFKNAPTAIDIDNLVFNSTDPDIQDSELTNVITRASSWIDTHCNQILSATTNTEQQRCRISADGTIRFHPNNAPIIAVTNIEYGTDPNNLTTAQDPSVAWLESQQVIFPIASFSNAFTSQGPLAFGFPSNARAQVFIKYTYVNGYVNTVIVSATATQSTLTVINANGITAGQQLKIYDGMNSENVTVASTYTFGSTTVPLVSPLVYTHSAGVSISALPAAIKEAAILVTTAMLKTRGDNSMTMAVTSSASEALPNSQNISNDMDMAISLLKPYRRIR